MAGQASQDIFQQATNMFAQKVDEYASGIAQRLGQPMSGSQLSRDQVLQRWNYTPLGDQQTADMHYHQLVASGMPPGQALDAVYPFRKMLFSGPDLKSQIDTAKQIAGWNTEANGAPPPESDPSKLPLLHWAGTMNNQPPAVPSPPLPAQAVGGGASIPPPPAMPGASPTPGQMPPVQVGAMPGIQPVPMASGGIVTQPTVALIGEAGPEMVVPLQPSVQESLGRIGQGASDPGAVAPQGTEIQQYIAQAAQSRGIDPLVALSVAYNEGGLTNPAARGTFNTGSSWWPFQLHYGGNGYDQYGNVAGLGNEFTAATGYHPGDPAAWRASVDFALDTALQRGWYPTWYGSKPAGVSTWQGIPRQMSA